MNSKPTTSRRWLLISAGVALFAAGMSGGWFAAKLTSSPTGATHTLEGKAYAPLGKPRVIYYKVPFASPPHLTYPDGGIGYKVTDEKSDSFTVEKQTMGPSIAGKLRWKAEGVPGAK